MSRLHRPLALPLLVRQFLTGVAAGLAAQALVAAWHWLREPALPPRD